MPRDYTTQGSAFKAKERDGDQTDRKGSRAAVPAEEFMPEQQRAAAAPSQAGRASGRALHTHPREKRCPPSCARLPGPPQGLPDTPSPAGKAGPEAAFMPSPFSQSGLPGEGPGRSAALGNLNVNELQDMHREPRMHCSSGFHHAHSAFHQKRTQMGFLHIKETKM